MRIFIECTRTLKTNLHTGIQRVVRRYIHEGQLLAAENPDLEILLVVFDGKDFRRLPHLPLHPLEVSGNEHPGGLPNNQVQAESAQKIQPGAGDVLLLMDASWYVEGIWSALFRVRDKGCRLVFLCHDVIPLRRPDYFPEATVQCFKQYWTKVSLYADQLICVSATTRRKLLACWREGILPTPNDGLLRSTAYNYLGGNFCNDANNAPLQQVQRFSDVFTGQQPVFLCVGTIEVRKNHGLLLEAFEQLWADRGGQAKLILAGQYGWKARPLWNRLQQHPALNDKLFMYESLSDQQLNFLYRKVDALVSASGMEGFGLPVAEALYQHLPVLISDIPVYREITQQKPAELFGNASELYALLKRYTSLEYKRPAPEISPDNNSRGWISWRESFAGILRVLQSSRTGEPTYAERY